MGSSLQCEEAGGIALLAWLQRANWKNTCTWMFCTSVETVSCGSSVIGLLFKTICAGFWQKVYFCIPPTSFVPEACEAAW